MRDPDESPIEEPEDVLPPGETLESAQDKLRGALEYLAECARDPGAAAQRHDVEQLLGDMGSLAGPPPEPEVEDDPPIDFHRRRSA